MDLMNENDLYPDSTTLITEINWGTIKTRNTHRVVYSFNPYNADLIVFKPWIPKGFFQFEIIINVFVSSFRFI